MKNNRTSWHLREKVVKIVPSVTRRRIVSHPEPLDSENSSITLEQQVSHEGEENQLEAESPESKLPELTEKSAVFQRSKKTLRSPEEQPLDRQSESEETANPTTPCNNRDIDWNSTVAGPSGARRIKSSSTAPEEKFSTPLRPPHLSLGVTPIIEDILSLPVNSASTTPTPSASSSAADYSYDELPTVFSINSSTPSPATTTSATRRSHSSPAVPTERTTMALVPFAEIYRDIPKCTGEPHIVSHFISICDGLYEDFFADQTPSRDPEFVRLLTIKLSPEVYSNFRGQSITSYQEFKSALLSAVSPEISLTDALTAMQRLSIHQKESLKAFGKRVEDALQTLNNSYSCQLGGSVPQSLKETNTQMAINAFANSIRDNDTRILLLARNFPNLSSAILFAMSRLKTSNSTDSNSKDDKNQSTFSNPRSFGQASNNCNSNNNNNNGRQNRSNLSNWSRNNSNNNQNDGQNTSNSQNSSNQSSFQNRSVSNSQNSSQNSFQNRSRQSFNNSRPNMNDSRQENRNNETTVFIPRGGNFNSTAYPTDQEYYQNDSENEIRSAGCLQDLPSAETQ